MQEPEAENDVSRKSSARVGWVLFLLALLLLIGGLSHSDPALADEAVVRGVLFYSPTCPHCHQVITVDLPPILEVYGEQVEIIAVNTAHPGGYELYQAALQHFNVPEDRRGVPILIVGDSVLFGSLEIPQKLPGTIDAYLAQGGVDWPDIPGLIEAIESAENAATATPTLPPSATTAAPTTMASSALSPSPATTLVITPTPNPQPADDDVRTDPPGVAGGIGDLSNIQPEGIYARFQRDPLGNSISTLVLVTLMVVSLTSIRGFATPVGGSVFRPKVDRWRQWAIPGLVILGLGISIYMAYAEIGQNTAVCGPVGDCNTVQQSEYARLFGLIPIGIVGVIGYAALGLCWAIGQWGNGRARLWAKLMLSAMALFGTLFSIYLTFLEPFVIGATCLWCLSSAITMALILLLSSDAGRMALSELTSRSGRPVADRPGDTSKRGYS
jgi:uncharacterized membrane protein